MGERKYKVQEFGPRIEAFLAPVLRVAGFEASFEVAEGEHSHPEIEDPEIVVRFRGADVDLLLANRAGLLLALEHLTMEALHVPAEHHALISFDANDYRMLRIEELRLSAAAAAERVKKSRVPFHFNPMSSRERRIIHLSLREETEVRSESTGMGPIRQVVIVPSEMKTVPEPVRPPEPRESGPRREGPRRDGRDGPRRSGPRFGR